MGYGNDYYGLGLRAPFQLPGCVPTDPLWLAHLVKRAEMLVALMGAMVCVEFTLY